MMDQATQSTVIIIVAIGSQLAILITAVFTGWAAVTAKRIAQETKAETQTQTAKLDTVAKETAVVLGHVNSEKTKDAATIEFQARENQMLRDQLIEKDHVAGLLAQAAAHRSRKNGIVQEAPVPAQSLAPLQVEVMNQPLTVVTEEPTKT